MARLWVEVPLATGSDDKPGVFRRIRRLIPFIRRDDPFIANKKIEEAFPEAYALLKSAARDGVRRYRRSARRYRYWFQSTGVLEIIISISLPILFTIEVIGVTNQPEWNYFLASLSALIAIIAALRTFFGWDTNWQLYELQHTHLRNHVREWEVEMLQLVGRQDGARRALTRTAIYLRSIAQIYAHENETFFNTVRPPDPPHTTTQAPTQQQ